MQLVLRGAAAKIRATFLNVDGAASEPTNPKVTIVRDSDGAEIESEAAAEIESGGVVSFTLDPADIPEVDLLHASWTADDAGAADTEVGVVGGFLCSLEAISEAIVAANGQPPDTEVLRAKREQAERKLEDVCNVAFRPSYAREQLTGRRGDHTLLLGRPRPLSILSATLDDEDVAAELSVAADGTVMREEYVFPRGSELDIAYVHGWASPPEPITRAAVALASFYAASVAGDDDRVTRYREAEQEAWLTVAGEGSAETSIPEVNTAIRDYAYQAAG